MIAEGGDDDAPTHAAAGVLPVAVTIGRRARAADGLRLAVGQKGNWDTSVAELGQRAGIFRKHDLELDILYTQGSGETLQAVLSRSAEIGVAGGTLGTMGAFSKGAPLRIIASEATGAGDLFWYVRAEFADQVHQGNRRQDRRVFHAGLLDQQRRAGLCGHVRDQARPGCHRRHPGHVHAGDVGTDRRRMVGGAISARRSRGGKDPHHRERQ